MHIVNANSIHHYYLLPIIYTFTPFSSFYCLYTHTHTHTHTHTVSFQLVYISSDPEDYQKEYEDSLMYKYVNLPVNWIRLNITIPPGPEVTPTTTRVTEERIIMKIIPKENKGKERSKININLYYIAILCYRANLI